MKRFAELYEALDRTTSTNAKVAALVAYLAAAPPADAAWALYFLTGRRLKRLLPTRLLHEWTRELTGLPEWLVHESYAAAGDFAETIALLLDGRLAPVEPESLRRAAPARADLLPFDEPPPVTFDAAVDDVSLARWLDERLVPLRDLDDEERRVRVITWWSRLPRVERFLLNKLLTGEFRVGVSHTLVVRALSQHAGLDPAVIEHRLMGAWEPSAAAFAQLVAAEAPSDTRSRPYPFCLASPLEQIIGAVPAIDRPDGSRDAEGGDVVAQIDARLGARETWLAEWKWDGIRAQVIQRAGETFIWSRGDELITDRFPEVTAVARWLPDGTVLDGELLAFADGRPRPFADLQQRIGRVRDVSRLAEDVPVVFVAFDLLEEHGVDIRSLPLRERRTRLAWLIGTPYMDRSTRADDDRSVGVIRLSEEIGAESWPDLATLREASRTRGVEGLMLKRWDSAYRPGRKRGDWWKWKIAPHTIDAVLIYAQPGSGRRASLFTDYTFGVWDAGQLVPVAKAYSGLTDAEIDELDRWVRRHTTERFGPVSAVEPEHVFELGFERLARSSRHRSGIALRFPRMLRWRRDKTAGEADTLETLTRLLAVQDDPVSRG